MITVFTGKNSFALQLALQQIISDTTKMFGELSVERFDAAETEYDKLLGAVQSLPFLVEKKLVLITSIAAQPVLLERIEDFASRVHDRVEAVLVDSNLDKRRSYYKVLKQVCSLKEFSELRQQELPAWLCSYAKRLNSELSLVDAGYMVSRVGTDQQQLVRDLEKLCLFSSKITKETIDLLTDELPATSIFSLLDAIFSGNHKAALDVYRALRKARVEPQYVISMLAWQLFQVAQAVYYNPAPADEKALVAAGMSPFSAGKAIRIARNSNKKDLKQMITRLVELDVQTKTSVDADAGIELFLLETTSF
jgi:DNA polymerase III subunit delta